MWSYFHIGLNVKFRDEGQYLGIKEGVLRCIKGGVLGSIKEDVLRSGVLKEILHKRNINEYKDITIG